ncbi:Uncharacterised protein [uncultured archaeon]|nr:Uncharacterised protein [uncultured archaeon]
MREITFNQIREKNLKLVGRISSVDFSKVILMIERAKDNTAIKYYLMDFIFYNQNTQEGYFKVSFWKD